MSPLYRRFFDRLPDGAHILDAGCGSGRDATAFATKGFRVTALDASEAVIVHALTGLPCALFSRSIQSVLCVQGIAPLVKIVIASTTFSAIGTIITIIDAISWKNRGVYQVFQSSAGLTSA